MLEELLCQYEELCKSYCDLRLALQEIAKPYTCVKTVNGKDTMVIEYERRRKKMWKLFVSIPVGVVNSSSILEAYEYVIDLKIAFSNRKDAK